MLSMQTANGNYYSCTFLVWWVKKQLRQSEFCDMIKLFKHLHIQDLIYLVFDRLKAKKFRISIAAIWHVWMRRNYQKYDNHFMLLSNFMYWAHYIANNYVQVRSQLFSSNCWTSLTTETTDWVSSMSCLKLNIDATTSWDRDSHVVYAKSKFIHFFKDVEVAKSLTILEELTTSISGNYTISEVELDALLVIKTISNLSSSLVKIQLIIKKIMVKLVALNSPLTFIFQGSEMGRRGKELCIWHDVLLSTLNLSF